MRSGTMSRIMDRLSDYVGLVAMYLIFVMVGVLLLDAVTRNVIHIPLHWCIEFAQFTLAAYYLHGRGRSRSRTTTMCGWTFSIRTCPNAGKARMDLVTDRLPDLLSGRDAGRLDLEPRSTRSRRTRRRFSMWNPSMIPIKALMVVCIVLMLLQAFSLVFKHIATLRGENARHELRTDRAADVRIDVALLLTGQRVFAAIGFVAAGAALLLYGTGGVEMPFNEMFKLFNWFPMLTLPLFIYMGYILSESGIAEDLYRMLHVWFGRLAGGLAIGTILLMVIISAMNGLSVAGMAIGATIALPEMLRRGYDKVLIIGRRAGRLVARHPDPAIGRAWCFTA